MPPRAAAPLPGQPSPLDRPWSRGEITIGARYVDCADDEAFVLAVAANIGHHLPLTLTERRAAAARVLAWRPDAPDRWAGSVTGLAPRTIASVRSGQPAAR